MVEINRSNIHYFAIAVIVIITLLIWLLAYYIKKTVRHEIITLKAKANKEFKPIIESSYHDNNDNIMDEMNDEDYQDIDSYIDPLADVGVAHPINPMQSHEPDNFHQQPPQQEFQKLTHDNILMRDMMDGSIKN